MAIKQPHPENTATAALGYILRKSAAGPAAVSKFLLHAAGIDLPGDLHFENQARDAEGNIPDLVGRDPEQNQRLIVEAKFWAPFTHRQPKRYLQRLDVGRDGALLVIAPQVRCLNLWPEILKDCDLGCQPLVADESSKVWLAHVDEHRVVALTSWGALLDVLEDALKVAGERPLAEDVAQLQVLCKQMDADAFLPLVPDDLSDALARRFCDYGKLVVDLVHRALKQGLCSVDRLRFFGGTTFYGCHLLVGKHWYGVFFNSDLWRRHGQSPIWFEAYWNAPANFERVRRALAPLSALSPPHLLTGNNGQPVVPLLLPTGCEEERVLQRLLIQFGNVVDLLRKGISETGPTQPTPEETEPPPGS